MDPTWSQFGHSAFTVPMASNEPPLLEQGDLFPFYNTISPMAANEHPPPPGWGDLFPRYDTTIPMIVDQRPSPPEWGHPSTFYDNLIASATEIRHHPPPGWGDPFPSHDTIAPSMTTDQHPPSLAWGDPFPFHDTIAPPITTDQHPPPLAWGDPFPFHNNIIPANQHPPQPEWGGSLPFHDNIVPHESLLTFRSQEVISDHYWQDSNAADTCSTSVDAIMVDFNHVNPGCDLYMPRPVYAAQLHIPFLANSFFDDTSAMTAIPGPEPSAFTDTRNSLQPPGFVEGSHNLLPHPLPPTHEPSNPVTVAPLVVISNRSKDVWKYIYSQDGNDIHACAWKSRTGKHCPYNGRLDLVKRHIWRVHFKLTWAFLLRWSILRH